MKRTFAFLFSTTIILFFNSCKTDFDVTAPYKEIAVIYGLLNTSDTVQWVRINKAYLGEGNALVMAQQPDSINYPDILDVKLEEYNNANTLLRSLSLVRDSSIQKESGVFATIPNILYRTDYADRINSLYKYKLVVYNRESSNTITASTIVIDNVSFSYPTQSSGQINWISPYPFEPKWYTTPEGFVYQLTIRFHYDESSLSTPPILESKYADWIFPEEEGASSSSLSVTIPREDFYKFIARSIQSNSAVQRKIGKLDFILTVGAKEFYTYIQVNHPPTGVNQNIPQYTNVTNGIGIFSSKLNQTVIDKDMDTASKDSLAHGSVTGNLQFIFP